MQFFISKSGGKHSDWSTRNEILEYNPGTKNWTQIGTMKEARARHTVSVVNYEDYDKYCQ